MRAYLKVKIKSLAVEAQIIRAEERRHKARNREVFWGLRNHRIYAVRKESRAACLAYGFLRGRAYLRLEAKCHTPPDWRRVEALALKYGGGDSRDVKQKFEEWKTACV